MTDDRRQAARRARIEAAEMAFSRTHPEHLANGDEERLASANYAMSFTKGLDHDPDTGLVIDKSHFRAFRTAIDNGFIEPFTASVPVPTLHERRKWEAPTAGTAFDLQGPDAQAVTMPPAPALGSHELAFEMAEVYELALLRDVPFYKFDSGGGSQAFTDAIGRLNGTAYATNGFTGRPRLTDANGNLDRQTAFRGSSPGVDKGPYLSQFLLMGTSFPGEDPVIDEGHIKRGEIAYGAQCITQKVVTARPELDYMQLRDEWLHIQQGYNKQRDDSISSDRRFIHTPRDLATYVHFDALYQAYLNATLMLWAMGTPLDPGFAQLSGGGKLYDPQHGMNGIDLNAGGFALYGGPHILTMVTEVATRALKAVRFQKFNNHLRLRPEALAGRIEFADDIHAQFATCDVFRDLRNQIADTVSQVRDFNDTTAGSPTALLPMAFPEGSPMHPTYGAGHATVAGACVTVLKAFFDTGTVLGKSSGRDDAARTGSLGFYADVAPGDSFFTESMNDGTELRLDGIDCPLTLEGELNKLAANISIGRNMAGVHYFSDYYDSLRMGEQIAIGMLQEQAVCYPTDPFVMSVPTFDGDVVRIGRR